MGLRGCHLESKAMISPADFLIDAGVQYGSVAQEQIVDSRNDNDNNVIRGMFHGFSWSEFLQHMVKNADPGIFLFFPRHPGEPPLVNCLGPEKLASSGGWKSKSWKSWLFSICLSDAHCPCGVCLLAVTGVSVFFQVKSTVKGWTMITHTWSTVPTWHRTCKTSPHLSLFYDPSQTLQSPSCPFYGCRPRLCYLPLGFSFSMSSTFDRIEERCWWWWFWQAEFLGLTAYTKKSMWSVNLIIVSYASIFICYSYICIIIYIYMIHVWYTFINTYLLCNLSEWNGLNTCFKQIPNTGPLCKAVKTANWFDDFFAIISTL